MANKSNNKKQTKKNNNSKKNITTKKNNNNKQTAKKRIKTLEERMESEDKSLNKIFEQEKVKENTSKLENIKQESKMYDILEENIVTSEKKGNSKIVIILILIICILSNIGIVYYFKTHPKIKIKTKTVIQKEYKVPENIVFLGDSITDFYDLKKYYPDKNIVNSGICGNTTKDILNDMEERVYRYNPSKVFLLIGINDLHHQVSPEEIIENTEKIVEKIQENRPQTEIFVESVYPINNSDDKKIEQAEMKYRKNSDVEKINEGLKKYCEEKEIKYIDMYSKLIDEDGNLKLEYTKEGLHISEEGYEVITKELKKYVDNDEN